MSRLWTWVVPAREEDWDALYAAEMPRVYNFFRYRVGDGPVAEDLTSATFEKAWRARDRYRRDLASFMSRGLVLSYIYTGQVQHRYNYASQMEDAFPELRRYPSAEVRYLIMADHTFSQAAMRAELVDVVVGWMRRTAAHVQA